MTYLGGVEPGSKSCACGMTNSCVERDEKCNCDKNDEMMGEDRDYRTDESNLQLLSKV